MYAINTFTNFVFIFSIVVQQVRISGEPFTSPESQTKTFQSMESHVLRWNCSSKNKLIYFNTNAFISSMHLKFA